MQKQADDSATQKIVLFATTVTTIITPYMASSINIALPAIGSEFGLDAVTLPWVTTIFLLVSAVFCIPFGRLADTIGRRKVFLLGVSIFTLTSLLLASVSSGFLLLVLRGIQATGASMIYSTGIAILVSVYPPQARGKVLGINAAATYIGLSVGPYIGGFLTQNFGWRSIFIAVVPLGLIVIAASLWKSRWESATAKKEQFDFIGSTIYTLSLISIMYGFPSLSQLSGIIFVAGGLVGAGIFAAWELRVENPVLNLKLLLSNRIFAFSNLAALINFSATYAINFLLSLYLQYIRGFSPQNAGAVLLWMPVMQAILSPFIGPLSDRVRPQLLAAAGMGTTAVGLTLFTFLTGDTPLLYIIVTLLICGIGLALFASPNSNAVMSSIDSGSYGVASGTMQTMRLIGQNLSLALATLVIALLIGRVQLKPEHYPTFLQCVKLTFMIFAPLGLVGVFASLGGLPRKTKAPLLH
jgi:EmrB/QacA subfamily drug resistance transporter